jgi:hypothetical protein
MVLGGEHRHIIYKRHCNTLGRCIGHGGLHVHLRRGIPAAIVEFENCRSFDGQYGVHGFALLEFDGPNCEVRYIDEDGTISFTENFSAGTIQNGMSPSEEIHGPNSVQAC